jgi:four helix bundle protein
MVRQNIRHFRELRVYRAAFDAAMRVFELSRSFPPEERYVLVSQMRRASRSVCGNLAEAWRKRRYPAAFIAKLSDAEGEAAEMQVWIEFAQRCGYISEQEAAQHDSTYDTVLAQIVTMVQKPEDWAVS